MSTQRRERSPEELAAAQGLQILNSTVRAEDSGDCASHDDDEQSVIWASDTEHDATQSVTLRRSSRGRDGRAVGETMLAKAIPMAESFNGLDGSLPQEVKSDNCVTPTAHERRTVGKGSAHVHEDSVPVDSAVSPDNVSSSSSYIRRSTRKAALEGRRKVWDSAHAIAKDERAGRRLRSTRIVSGRKNTRIKQSKSPRVAAVLRRNTETEEASDPSQIGSESMEAVADETHQSTEAACEAAINDSEELNIQNVVVNEEHHSVALETSREHVTDGKKYSATTAAVHDSDFAKVQTDAAVNEENPNAGAEAFIRRVVQSDSSRMQEPVLDDESPFDDDAGTANEDMPLEMELSEVVESVITGLDAASDVANESRGTALEASNVPVATGDCIDVVMGTESFDLQEPVVNGCSDIGVAKEGSVAALESLNVQDRVAMELESSKVEESIVVVNGRAAVAGVGDQSAVASEIVVESNEWGPAVDGHWHGGEMNEARAVESIARGGLEDTVDDTSQDGDMEMAENGSPKTLKLPDCGRWSRMDVIASNSVRLIKVGSSLS